MKKIHYILLSLAITAFLSCSSNDKKAQALVDGFMKEYLLNQDGISEVEYSEIDSTYHVSESALTTMRNSRVDNYRKGISYGKPTKKLLYMSVKYKRKGNAEKQTFYFDDQLSTVVAFKDN